MGGLSLDIDYFYDSTYFESRIIAAYYILQHMSIKNKNKIK